MELEVNRNGDVVDIKFTGVLDQQRLPEVRNALMQGHKKATWRVDLGAVEDIDAAAMAGLLEVANAVLDAGGKFEIVSAARHVQAQLDLYGFSKIAQEGTPSAASATGSLERTGEKVYQAGRGLEEVVLLLYDFAYWCLIAPLAGKGLQTENLVKETRRNGFDAIPVVALVSFLFGVVLSVNGAYLLGKWGQNQLIADMVGVSLAREVAPLLAAIMLAARSGSAISAEIGTMQVRDEVDAMWVMGMNPAKFLVVPKVLSLALAVPILSLVANLAGMVGAFLVTTTVFGIPASTFLDRLSNAVLTNDILGGLGKSAVFGLIIGVVGCWYGFSVRGSAEEVGQSTTGAVVTGIVLIIVVDGIFSSLLYLFA